jgi:prophage regulatory protein
VGEITTATRTSHVTSMSYGLATSQVTTSMVTMHHLVGSAEIGRMLGVSRQRVQQLVNRDDFPRPDAVLEMGKVWKRTEVETWARDHGRPVAEAAEGERGDE